MARKVDPAKLAAAAQNLEGGNVADPEVLQDLLEDMASVIDDNADGLDGAVKKSGDTMTGMLSFDLPLSVNNKIIDMQQGYSIYSDNFGPSGSNGTRLWLGTPNLGHVVIGPRSSLESLHSVRIRTATLTVGASSDFVVWHAGNLPVESGTWTPTISGTTTPGTPPYNSQIGFYYRIGKLVHLSFGVQINNKGGMSGQLRIGGVPFLPGNNGLYEVAKLSIVSSVTYPSNAQETFGLFQLGGSVITLWFNRSGNYHIGMTADDISEPFLIRGSITYEIQ